MRAQYFIIIALLSLMSCIEPEDDTSNTYHIVFSNDKIKISEGCATLHETTVIIEKPGAYYVSGETEEGNIVIKSSSVKLFLQDLNLSSKNTAPIIITKNLKDVKIINLKNTYLQDFENPETTEGECAVIKIKKNSSVSFKNNGIFNFYGECKNIISGGSQVSIIFEKSDGEYIIHANKTAISSDGLLEFNGGIFTIISEYGDAIKSLPGKNDTDSLGKILINDGNFDIHCYNDAFTAKNNITILKGKFHIKTEEGYDSITYDENESSKGFKVTNDNVGSELKIYSGEFSLNTADDAFRSNRDITILSGKFIIYSKDDGICAKYNLVLGKKDSKLDDLNIKILHSFESLEGMTITIYSGKIIASSEDDSINASGVIKKDQNKTNRYFNFTNYTHFFNYTRRNKNFTNYTHFFNYTGRHQRRNKTNDEKGNTRHNGSPGNSSYSISIYDGEIYIFSDRDGIDTNGNIYIHGGNTNIFSKGSGSDEPIDHNGNFTLFNAEILGVGSKGVDSIHRCIQKGNQMYAYYSGDISKYQLLEIRNEKDEIIKEGSITTDINYIFYSSSKLNENYHFFIYDELNDNKIELNITYGYPEIGLDNEDEKYIKNEQKREDEDKKKEEKNSNENIENNNSNIIKQTILVIIILFLF